MYFTVPAGLEDTYPVFPEGFRGVPVNSMRGTWVGGRWTLNHKPSMAISQIGNVSGTAYIR